MSRRVFKNPRSVLTIDIGGSSIRAAVFDEQGRLKGLRSRIHRFIRGNDDSPFTEELDPVATWASAIRVIRGAMRDAGIDSVEAVAATGQRHGLALTANLGQTLYLGPTSEARAFFHGQAMEEDLGKEIYSVTGHLPALLGAPAKLQWLADTHPRFEHTTHVLTLDGWLTHQLSGSASMSDASGIEIGLVGLQSRRWANALLKRLDAPLHLLPPLCIPGAVVGTVSDYAATATGLPSGTPVVAAGPDTQCGLLAIGARETGDLGILAGSTAPIQMVVDRPVLDPDQRTWTGAHILADRWVVESGATDAGGALTWLAKMIFGDDADALRRFDRLAAKASPGSRGSLAMLGPRQADATNLGPRWGGLLLTTPLAASRIDRPHLIRAAMENVAFAIKANIEQIEKVVGAASTSISVAGGLTASRIFCRILTDVLGSGLRIAPAEATALGAAICAASGVGLHTDMESACKRMGGSGRLTHPDPVRSLEYEGLYERWRAMSNHMDQARDIL